MCLFQEIDFKFKRNSHNTLQEKERAIRSKDSKKKEEEKEKPDAKGEMFVTFFVSLRTSRVLRSYKIAKERKKILRVSRREKG